MSSDITIKDGRMYGGWRQPINIWMDAPGSIHNDDVARSVGMRGGTIPGTIHLNLFPPLLIELWGQRWFEHGTLSIFYTFATTHREDVRAVIALPPKGAADAQVEAWIETPGGQTVGKGTVSVGEPKAVPYCQTIEMVNAKPEELRIMDGMKAGDILATRDVLVTQEALDKGLETITDPLDWYKGKSPWGGSILNPAAMHNALAWGSGRPDGKPRQGVGFFGATELRNVNGPVKVGVPYRLNGKLICVGVTAKTEFFWFESYLEEKETGKRVAEMRQMDRVMKAGSPHYQ